MRAMHQHGSSTEPNDGKRVHIGDRITTVESVGCVFAWRIPRQYVEHQDSSDHEPDVAQCVNGFAKNSAMYPFAPARSVPD